MLQPGPVHPPVAVTGVAVHTVKIALRHDNGAVGVAEGGNGDGRRHHRRARGHNHGLRAPLPVGIVRFFRGQGHPAHFLAGPDPGHAARIPARFRSRRSRRLPEPSVVDVDPVPVMVGHVAEGLGRHPGGVAVPFHPTAGTKRRPAIGHVRGPPQHDFPALVQDAFPAAVFVQLVGIAPQGLGQVLDRSAGRSRPLGPEPVESLVPGRPGRVHGATARTDFDGVGDQRRRAGHDPIRRTILGMDEVHGTGQGQHLHGLVPHVDVERGAGARLDHAVGRGDVDRRGTVLVRKPSHAGRLGKLGQSRFGRGELHLGTRTQAQDHIVRHDDLGPGIRIGVQGIRKPERGILDRGNPVVLRLDKQVQLALHVRNTPNQGLGLGQAGRQSDGQEAGQKSEATTTPQQGAQNHMPSVANVWLSDGYGPGPLTIFCGLAVLREKP